VRPGRDHPSGDKKIGYQGKPRFRFDWEKPFRTKTRKAGTGNLGVGERNSHNRGRKEPSLPEPGAGSKSAMQRKLKQLYRKLSHTTKRIKLNIIAQEKNRVGQGGIGGNDFSHILGERKECF